MSRSEKFQPIATFFASFGFPPHPTGECGCGYCCNGIKKREKRAEHKADRRAGRQEINRQINTDLHPVSIKNAGSMTYGQDTAA